MSKVKDLIEEVVHWRKRYTDTMARLDRALDNNERLNKPIIQATKADLEQQLAELNYQEKYPLCAHIKEHCGKFPAFYVKGKFLNDFTKQGAIDYAKKHLKQKEFEYINDDGYEAYEVKKIRKETV